MKRIEVPALPGAEKSISKPFPGAEVRLPRKSEKVKDF